MGKKRAAAYISSIQAGKLIGLSPTRIAQLCKEGRIVSNETGEKAELVGGTYLIPADFIVVDHQTFRRRRQ